MSLRIVIPGGSGQIGTLLASHFMSQGHDVTVLSRNPQPAPWRVVGWDGVTAGDWVSQLEGSDVCINLAGRSVNCRYHPANRKQIYDSRIVSTRLLNQVIPALSHPPRVWLNASTATIYRHAMDRPMDEATGELGGNEPGAPETWNFSIKVARDWESAFFETPSPRTRKIALRSAVTLIAARGGAFDLLSSLVRRGLGGTQGSGSQMVSWMHQADFVRAIDFLIAAEDFSGVVNLASPHPLPNREFMHSLRRAWHIPFGLPAPAPLLEIGCWLLKSETELVLKSRYVVPGRLQAAGFQFLYPDWPSAAQDLAARTMRA
jgi:uncharacterized protein